MTADEHRQADARSVVEEYFDHLHQLIERLRTTQRDALGRAAQCVAECLRNEGVVHLFGTGHSHMLAEEVFCRAGGLVPIDAMLDERVVLSGGATRSTETERMPGAAADIAARYELRRGDVGIVISQSGRNPVPVEMAQLMKGKGMRVIAVTSLAHSRALPPREPPGVRLFEVADIVLDTGVAYGDAALTIPGVPYPTGASSTVIGAALLQALMIAVMERLVAAGAPVVDLPSANVADADLAAVMAEVAKYRHRIRHM